MRTVLTAVFWFARWIPCWW